MKFDQIITPELRLLESLQRGTDPLTRKNLQIMHENFVVPYSKYLKSQFTLMEAEMTADQIQQVFGHAEKIATAGGDNKTMLGQGASAVGAAAGAIGKGAVAAGKGAADLAVKGAKGAKDLAAKLVPDAVKQKFEASLPAPDAGPVEGFEQKATQAVAAIEDPKAKKSLMDTIKQGLQNPATQQLIMAGVSGIAGVIASTATAGIGGYAGAAAAGAITGSLLGAVNAKMQGKSWGDAGKAALKGAAMGAAGGLIGKGVTDVASAGMDAYNAHQQQVAGAGEDPMKADNDMYGPGGSAEEKVLPVQGASSNPTAGGANTPASNGQTELTPAQSDKMTAATMRAGLGADTAAAPAAQPEAPAAAPAPAPVTQNTQDSDFSQAEINAPIKPSADVQALANQEAAKYGRTRASLDDWRAANAMAKGRGLQTQSRVNTGKPVIEYIDKELTARMWILHESVGKPRGNVHLTEAGIGDMFKKAGNWLKTKAGNLTNKVTADKLQQAWTKAGSPTDSGQVASIMVQAGVPQDSIDQIFKNMGLPAGSSTPAPAPAAAPAGPKQGLLGKAAGAVGGAIGGVKGAIAGAKDAFAQGKEQGFDSSRANQAGDAVGATGEANPYAKGAQAPEAGAAQPAPAAQGGAAQPTGGAPAAQGQAGGKAAPAAQGQAAPAAQGGTQQAGGTQAPAAAPAGQEPPPEENKPGIGDKVAGFIKDAEGAMKAGVGMGTTGQSLMQTGTPAKGEKEKPADAVTIKDAQGIEHSYKKVGQQWFDKDNKPVNAAQAAMLDKQAQQQAAMGKEKAPAEPTTTTLANPKDPKTGKPIDPKAQAGQAAPAAPAGQAAPAAAKPAPNYDPQTGKASPEQAKQDAQSRVWMIQQGIDPDNPMQDIPDDQIQARVDAEQKKQAAGQTAPAAAAPAAGQSPEEIRKAKQATAAKTAQDQMAANPAPAKAAPAVWKNNRAPAGTPASTSPQAAAATAQATPAAAQPAAKAHTGGKVAGQVSMTPGAIKKRDARAAAKAAPNDVMARMAKQLAPAEKPAAPNFGQQQTGYASVKTNAPTGVPQVGGPQPTTGAKAVPAQQPAATPAAAPAQSKQDQIDADAHAWFNQKQKARNQAEVSFDDWKQNYKGKPQGPAVPAPQGVETPAAPNFGTPPAPTATPAAPTASAQADANKPGFLQSKIKGSQVPAKQPEMAGTDFSAMLARKAKVRL